MRDLLATVPDVSICCVVTSPPYWGLRNYGVAHRTWGGADGASVCPARGAWLGALGMEPDPAAFVDHLTEAIARLWRVLRPDATLWLNLGDAYAGSRKGQRGDGSSQDRSAAPQGRNHGSLSGSLPTGWHGLPAKSLVGIPWRVALALQDEGWILRAEVIWAKRNAMPESVMDRPPRAHEQVFLFAKHARYYYDADAVRSPQGAAQRSVWAIASEPAPAGHFAAFPTEVPRRAILAGTSEYGHCPARG